MEVKRKKHPLKNLSLKWSFVLYVTLFIIAALLISLLLSGLFDAIEAAANGDTEAINRVLRHYSGYIAKLSMRQTYDEYGNLRWGVDEAMRRQLENKLVDAIVRRFRVA